MTDLAESAGNGFKVPMLVAFALILTLIGAVFSAAAWGYRTLDDKKADKEAVTRMETDVREIRNFLMGPKPTAR